MDKFDFAITINMSLVFQKEIANVSIKNVELKPAIISIPLRLSAKRDVSMTEPKTTKTLFDIVLETAKKYVEESKWPEFRAADLLRLARKTYPDLKRGSFSAHVIASAPNHTSYKHYSHGRDYFNYKGHGIYELK